MNNKYLEWLLKNHTDILKELMDSVDFCYDAYEVIEFLHEKEICPECFNKLKPINSQQLLTTDPYNIYEDTIGKYHCEYCGYIYAIQ